MKDQVQNNIRLEIHQRALEIVGQYKRAESDLIDILQKVDEKRVYLQFDCKNLYEYTLSILKLSESVAFNFIVVARKAREVPQLKQAIKSGELSVSKARKITPVLTAENQSEWLKLATELPQKKLEQQVAKACPQAAVPERMKFVSENRLNLQLGISNELREKLKRAQDIASQKSRKHVSLEETLNAALDAYLLANDSLAKSEQIKKRKNLSVARQVELRDRGQCTHRDADNMRCGEKRWLDVHHVVPRSKGGSDELENLRTLCSGHHRLEHFH